MSNFDNFSQAVQEGVEEIAKKMLKGFKDEALTDAKEFLELSKNDFKRWTKAPCTR